MQLVNFPLIDKKNLDTEICDHGLNHQGNYD